jgi:hypothetical protein
MEPIAQTMGNFKKALIANGFTQPETMQFIMVWLLHVMAGAGDKSKTESALAEMLAKANMLKPSS